MHAQTLDRDGDGSLLTHGRAWLFTDRSPNLEIEWVHGGRSCAATVDFDADEHAIVFHLAIPFLFSYFIVLRSLPAWLFPRRLFAYRRTEYSYMGEHRSIGVRVFDNAIWLALWDDTHESRSSDPWWMNVRISPVDLLLGRTRCAKTVLGLHTATLSLPEGDYAVEVEIDTRTWTRPRWPWWPLTQRSTGAWCRMENGVPVADSKRGSIYGCGFSDVTSPEVAIERLRAKVMEQREKRGGPGWVPRPGDR